tara:strand:+ start:95 stop:775 length:681 start_codon:yes stop_codon:yes gene_type:complete
MQSAIPTINIFEDAPSSNSQFSFRPLSTSLNSPDLLPLHNDPDKRFEQNRMLNGKTKYEEENTIIKSLEEEIVNMKHKMSFVYEKDEEIAKLTEQVRKLTKEKGELEDMTKDTSQVRLENQQLKERLKQYESYEAQVSSLKQENSKLKSKIRTDTIEDINTDEYSLEEVEEMIDVNIPKLRHVLLTRLKDKQTDHIEKLIDQYGLKRKNKVKRSLMEEMLEQAIHL